MSTRAIERLLDAIGYPERASAGAVSFTLQVDGVEIAASEAGNALRLVCRLTDDAAQLPRIAEYAAGRMLREDATPACDGDGAFLWQDAPYGAGAQELRRLFETFMDSCDWWRERLSPDAGRGEAELSPNEMRILP